MVQKMEFSSDKKYQNENNFITTLGNNELTWQMVNTSQCMYCGVLLLFTLNAKPNITINSYLWESSKWLGKEYCTDTVERTPGKHR